MEETKSMEVEPLTVGLSITEPGDATPDPTTRSSKFDPKDLTRCPPLFSLPNELWLSVLSTPCSFEPQYFLTVMTNLIKNPNITSTFVFRAEIYYDSENDVSVSEDPNAEHLSERTKYMKPELRPIKVQVPGFQRQRTWVRRMIPRNPQVDKSLVQTCHQYKSDKDDREENLVLYLPHIEREEDMPYYHPKVKSLAFLHAWNEDSQQGQLSIHYSLLSSVPLNNRLQRTALKLLQTIHKHAVGQLNGYQKRVHHDQIIDQKKFQDTYTRLKATYAKQLIGDWQEQTDPRKHVFEDLGIAAFLIELWNDMYNGTGTSPRTFPGFVDIGCGNGVLVNILIQEGYHGFGFDARQRKSWESFPAKVQDHLKEMLLVPQILLSGAAAVREVIGEGADRPSFQNGMFTEGIFIISNHADELTAWTPLLAYLNDSPFIAIPCCSHDLAGSRTRFGGKSKRPSPSDRPNHADEAVVLNKAHSKDPGPGPSSGSLAKNANKAKQPSAYEALIHYIAALTGELGYGAEQEMLRIPSTRNAAIVGRKRTEPVLKDFENREAIVRSIIEREVGSLEVVAKDWMNRAKQIATSKGNCH
jgi:tRNASer (uridine44-2'-O)-methyltransferase